MVSKYRGGTSSYPLDSFSLSTYSVQSPVTDICGVIGISMSYVLTLTSRNLELLGRVASI